MAKSVKKSEVVVERRDTAVVDGEKAIRIRITAKTHKALMAMKRSCRLGSLNQAAMALLPYIKEAETKVKAGKRKALKAKISRLQK